MLTPGKGGTEVKPAVGEIVLTRYPKQLSLLEWD